MQEWLSILEIARTGALPNCRTREGIRNFLRGHGYLTHPEFSRLRANGGREYRVSALVRLAAGMPKPRHQSMLATAEGGEVAAFIQQLMQRRPPLSASAIRKCCLARFGTSITVSPYSGQRQVAMPPLRTFQHFLQGLRTPVTAIERRAAAQWLPVAEFVAIAGPNASVRVTSAGETLIHRSLLPPKE